jgi:polysaccharide biosynthesis transport protein
MSRNYELIRPMGETPAPIARSERREVITPPADELDLDLHAVVRALLRGRVWIYACTASMLAAAILVCMVMTPRYQAVSEVQVLKQDMGRLSLGDANPVGGAYSDALDFNLTLQTQVRVLKSDVLALQVIKELNLQNAEEARGDSTKADSSREAGKLAAALRNFKANLQVEAVSGTRLIRVSYTHPDPQVAAKTVNRLVSDFVEYNFQVNYSATTRATDWLGNQLVELKSQVEKAQERAVELERESGILGKDEHDNIVITRLQQLNNEVTDAEADRIVKENVYSLARNGNPELIAGMLGGRTDAAGAGAVNSAALLTNLRQQEASLSAEYADAAAKYGSAYPRLIQIRERLASVRSSIAAELNKVVGRAKSQYELAAAREAAAKQSFAEQKKIATNMNDKAVSYLIAKQEADSSRLLYENLLGKLKEAGVLAGLRSSDLHVVDPAAVPDFPAKPNVPLYLAFGVLSGLALGVVCVFVVNVTDRTMRNVGAIESSTYVPVIGVIPQAGALGGGGLRHRLQSHLRNGLPRSPMLLSVENPGVAEAFRAVRTSLLLSGPEEPPKVIMITSGMAQEGKSFASLNLAASLACNGGKVLLVDADLRRGTLSRVLKRRSGTGLSQILLGGEDRDAYQTIEEVPGVTFLPAGARPALPAELLGTRQMTAMIEKWRQEFAYVLIDTPPLLLVTDPLVLSPRVDAVMLVVRFGVTNQQAVHRTVRMLRDVQAPRLRLLVNAMDAHSPEYSAYSEYGSYDAYPDEVPGAFLLLAPPLQPASKEEDA